MSLEEKKELFLKFKYDDKVIKETLANTKNSDKLYATLQASGLDGADKEIGTLQKDVATTPKKLTNEHIDWIIKYVSDKSIDSKPKLEAAYEYCQLLKEDLTSDNFKKACGVGVYITQEMIDKRCDDFLKANTNTFIENGGNFRAPDLIKSIKDGDMKFAGGELTKTYFAKAGVYIKTLNIAAKVTIYV